MQRKKKTNLVIYNLPEPQGDDEKVREGEDNSLCQDIFANSLNIEEVGIEKVIRLGKREEGRKRPLLVKMNSETEKWNVIGRAKLLKHEQDPRKKNIGISTDMTKKEREE